MTNKKCCGTCRYNVYTGDYECTNEDSEAYGLNTAYGDCCEEYENKEVED